ncbi:neuronal acetylcholine receptor subunit alpha-3-like isoform X2 [Oculina patagonica]
MNSIAAVLIWVKILSLFEGCSGSTATSWEHHIRADLLDNYDRKVRPVRKGKRAAEVLFALRVSRLVKVEWQNEFLTWNASDYGDLERVHFAPEEIWVPDIALFNNGDDEINLAGGPSKFVTDVAVNHKGNCVWSGPATFKVNCRMEIKDWPFDEQKCELAFGSYTYGKNLLKIKLFRDRKGNFANRYVKSGDWDIENITAAISETDHGDCCPFNFSEIVYTLHMKRKSLYYVFYLAIPSLTLTVVVLSSFLIHVESGERVGFVTTILLAMTVFLLVIPSYLPVTSDGLPILGVILQVTMIIIALVLFANIFVLRVYFKEGTPPAWIEKFCDFLSTKKSKNVKRIHASQPAFSARSAVVKSTATMFGIEMTESSRGIPALVDRVEEQEFTWHSVARKMDQVFFVVFVIASIIAYVVTFI